MLVLTQGSAFMGAGEHGEELAVVGARGYQRPNPNLSCAYHGAVLLILFPWLPTPTPSAPTITLLGRWPALC